MKQRKEIVLTEKEALAIAELLETLEAMSVKIDEHFTKECQQAGKYTCRIKDVINT